MRKFHNHREIDYFKHKQKREKLATYLRSSSFRKLSGPSVFSRKVAFRRKILVSVALVIFLFGLYCAVM